MRPPLKLIIFSCLLVGGFFVAKNASAVTVETLTTPGSGSWTAPPWVTSVQVEVWGGGGNGASSWGGAGGGAYAKKNSTSTSPGSSYNYYVGEAATSSYWINSSTVYAVGGLSATSTSGANGGASTACVGDVKVSGGNGGNGSGSYDSYCDAWSYYGGSGGNGANGGAGGTGAEDYSGSNSACEPWSHTDAGAAGQPGGGGGGGGGAGAAGQIVLTYTVPTNEFISIIDPDNGAGTDYTSLFAWEAAVQVDLSASTTGVFLYGAASGTIADNITVQGQLSGATATLVHQTASTTSSQILLKNISGVFQNGEQVYRQSTGASSTYIFLSDSGAAVIAVASVRSTNGSADVTAVEINGWTTSVSNYIKIWTDPGVGARHNGKWDDTKYRLVAALSSSYPNVIYNYEEYVRITGLQLSFTFSGSGYGPDGIRGATSISTSSSEIILDSLIVRGSPLLPNGNLSSLEGMNLQGGINYVRNSLVYNWDNDSSDAGIVSVSAGTKMYVYNSTVINNGEFGISNFAGATTVYAKNCGVFGHANNFYSTITQTTNSTAVPVFVDQTNGDYHLSPTDTTWKNQGTSLFFDATSSLTQDLDGSYRGAAFDIGSDEVPTELVSTICEGTTAGGDCTNRNFATLSTWEAGVNSDLTATSTRVFSGTASGTLAVGNTVVLYSGSTAMATGTIKATSSNQILITGIYGTTTPVSVASGTRWQVTSANTWRNSGTADQLGASPIAVAKIDGAWANPDTTAITITDWITSHDNYIKIYTTAAARHGGKWDDTKYRNVYSSGGGVANVRIMEGNVRIDGLQLRDNRQSQASLGAITLDFGATSENADVRISNNILNATGATGGSSQSFGVELWSPNNSAQTLRAWNNIIYDFNQAVNNNNNGIWLSNSYGIIYAYNNTIYNCHRAIWANNSVSRVYSKNNIAQNCSSGDCYRGLYATSSDYNISDIAGDAPNDTLATTSKTVGFVNKATSSSYDFHLADTDTVAKGLGINLYNDVNINVTNDIDSAARPATSTIGLSWDIGADQTAVKIYRSIAPSATAALTTGASNALTISSTTSFATFATALADNIGVGDVIIYNTGGTATGTAFIHGRSSSTVYTVKTASGTSPTAVSADTTWSIYRAYTTLANAEAGTENTGIANATIRNFDPWSGGADLVASNTQMNIAAYANGTTADTANISMDGWNTGQQNFIKVYTPTDLLEVGTSQRHPGKWDDTRYRLYVNGGAGILFDIYPTDTIIDGLQIEQFGSSQVGVMLRGGRSYFKNNIIKRDSANTSPAVANFASLSGQPVHIYNNVIYGWQTGIDANAPSSNSTAYNNTIVNCTTGISGHWSENLTAKNNIVQSCTDGYVNAFGALSDFNISDIAGDAPNATFATTSKAVVFVDSINKDLHLASTDIVAIDNGTSTVADLKLAVTDDIDGQLRRTPDIGADEASVEYATSIMESGGNFSTLSSWEAANQVDLATTTTAVFSLSSASGTIPANSSILGLTSGAVASTTVGTVSTSTQILLYNIASSTFLSGERIYIKGGATTSNYAILSNAGNPAIATAKIDGAWTNPDTTTVEIVGWTSSPTNYIRIYTTTAARHDGRWAEGKYRRLSTADTTLRSSNDDYIKIIGLQVELSSAQTTARGLLVDGTGSAEIAYNIVKSTGSGNLRGIEASTMNNLVYNNIVYGFNMDSSSAGIIVINASYVIDNTIYNCGKGFDKWWEATSLAVLKNNISYNNIDNYYGTYNASSTNNLSGPTQTDAPGLNPQNAKTVQFVDVANGDFHLSPADTAARNAGTSTIPWDTNLNFTQDIDGSYRGAAWDIGADEVPTEFVSTIMQSGGDHSTLNGWVTTMNAVELDLSSSTSRVFSGSRTGTVSAGDWVQLYRGGNDLAIGAGVQAIGSSTGQILLRAITGTTTPLILQTGDQLRVDGSNYWTASGTADQLGASPIAVAKIDGAWTSADTAAVAVDGITTSYDNFIKIYTTAAARHQGKWDANKYRLEISNSTYWTYPLNLFSKNVKIDGLQIKIINGTANWHVGINMVPYDSYDPSSGANYELSNNIIQGSFSLNRDVLYGIAYQEGYTSDPVKAKIWNNIIYGFKYNSNDGAGINIYGAPNVHAYVFNNTLYDNRDGIYVHYQNAFASLKNNLAYDNTNLDYNLYTDSSAVDEYSNNLSSDDSSPDVSFRNMAVQFVSIASTTSPDLHLAENDAAAKGQGVNAYNSSSATTTFFITNDIDNATRPTVASGLTWDIGADQTAVKIYRSIAPSATAALTTGASNALTISSSTSLATFATALADNIGVGDCLIYNTGGTATATAFIHGRFSSTSYTVKTASGTLPTAITADTSWSIYRAYTSLSNAEAGTENTGIANATIRNFDPWSGGADLVASNTQMNIAAYANGTTADTANISMDGWTTGQQNNIKIYTPVNANEVGVSQRHPGKWDDGKYKIVTNTLWDAAIHVAAEFVKFDGLQIENTAVGSNPDGISWYGSAGEINFSNSIIRNGRIGFSAEYSTGGTAKVWNNIIYDYVSEGIRSYHNTDTGTFIAYNNTVYTNVAANEGFYIQNAVVAILKNNIVQRGNSGSHNNNDYSLPGNGSLTTSNNISEDTHSPDSSYQNRTVNFVDEANKDFHLSPSDTAALDAGTSTPATDANLSFNDDIDGQTRRQWDIGADEGSVEYVTSLMQSGGNFSTLSSWEAANQVDLTATTTAVFSLSSASGTIPANASIMGLTSGAVASTTVGSVSTSTQILLYNIASSTFISGESIYIKGGATTSNYAILSNAGNPAIATVKIDEVWANPDTTAVTIDGWTTAPNNYIRIYTTPTARHAGKWDDNKYRLSLSGGSGFSAISNSESYVRIDGLQVNMDITGAWPSRSFYGINFFNMIENGETGVSNNIIRAINSTDAMGDDAGDGRSRVYGIYGVPSLTGGTPKLKIWNNIVYDITDPGDSTVLPRCIVVEHRDATVYLNNNTTVNCTQGYKMDADGSVVVHAKNNIAQNSTVGYLYEFHASSTNNISDHDDAPGLNPKNNMTVNFVDATNKDFHLSPTDTAAKDAGADLSGDSSLTLGMTGGVDIDGQKRGSLATSTAGGLGWDIGADEGPTIMYRSVGNDTNNLNSGGATVTITNSTTTSLATLSGPLPSNVGVGDVIQYGNPLTLAFITGRSSSTVYSVVNATGSLPVATSSASASIYRAHTLINNWQTHTTGTVNQSISASLRAQVLVAQNLVASNTAMFVAAYASTSPDTTAVNIGTWTTGAGNYIKVYTPVSSSEVGATQRHVGKWDDAKYRLTTVAGYRPISIYVNYISIDGLQISNDTDVDYGVGILTRPSGGATSTDIKISNNIIRTTMSLTNIITGLDLSYGAVYKVWNNIIYDFSNSSSNGAIFMWNDPSNGLSVSYIYNNTVYNSYYGIRNAGAGTTTAINNIIVGSGNTNTYVGTFASGTDYNATDGTDNIGQGTHNKIGQTFNFIDLTNRDFHLAPTDRAARDAGVSLAADPYLPFTVDIDGNSRPYGAAWDIGADEDADFVPDYQFDGKVQFEGNIKFW